MAEELRVMENKSCEDANTDLSPVCKIEIYSFFDPFSKDCFKISAILSKLRIEYNQYIRCLLYTSPSPRDLSTSRMPSSA